MTTKDELRDAYTDAIFSYPWDLVLTTTFSPRKILPFVNLNSKASKMWVSTNKSAVSLDNGKKVYDRFINTLNKELGFRHVPEKRIVWVRANEYHDSEVAHFHSLLRINKKIVHGNRDINISTFYLRPERPVCGCLKAKHHVSDFQCLHSLVKYCWNKCGGGTKIIVEDVQSKSITEARLCARYLAKFENIDGIGDLEFSNNFPGFRV